MFPFAVVNDYGTLRIIAEFLRDNERVFFSHTCQSARSGLVHWIPTFERYKTLTTPEFLPELFVKKNGTYTMEPPETSCEFNFQMLMLPQSDINHKGVRAFKWFQFAVAKSLPPMFNTERALWLKFLLGFDKNEGLTDRQLLVLKRRLESGKDEMMYVHDMRHWDIVRDMFMGNISINRLVFFSPISATNVNCYGDVFVDLSKRWKKTRYLDLQGKLSMRTLLAFPLVASDLICLTLRRIEYSAVSSLLSTILIRPQDAMLESLQVDAVTLDRHAENYLLDTLDTLPISSLLFSNTTLTRRGFSRTLSVIGNSRVKKLQFRECRLNICEVVQAVFLPTIPDSALEELVFHGVDIAEEAASALASCVESSNFLNKLSVEGCDLGPVCVKMLVEGLKSSSLSTLNLVGNDLGEEAHNLFFNVGVCGTMRNLFIDSCRICSHSIQDFRRARSLYREGNLELHVSAKGCKLALGPSCSLDLL